MQSKSTEGVSPVPASIPDATKRGAHSNHYEHVFYGILNRAGAIWTPLIFGSKSEAEAYREKHWLNGKVSTDIRRTHKVVPVEFRIEPAQAIEAQQGGDAKQAPSQDESAVHAPKGGSHAE